MPSIRSLGRRLYFAVPPGPRRVLLGPPRVVAQVLSDLRVDVWRFSGSVGEGPAAVPMDAIYAGTPTLRHYARWLVFPNGAEETHLGRCGVWSLGSLVRRQQHEGSERPALLLQQQRTWVHGLLQGGGLFYPVWVYGSAEVGRYHQHDSVAYDKKRFRRNGYDYRTSRSLADLRRFYDEFYLPFSRYTYGDTAEICNFERAMGKFREWEVVFVEKHGEEIAGGQIVYTPTEPKVSLTGVKDVTPERVREGAVASIYYYMVEAVRQQGYETISLGGARPSLNDGLMRFKRQRGFRMHSWADHGYALLPLARTAGLERFFERTPWVRVAGRKLVSTVFVRDAEACDPEDLAHRHLARGVDRLEVFRLDEGAEGAVDVPEHLAGRVKILPAQTVLGPA